MTDFYWNSKTGRFHNAQNNVFVARSQVLKYLDTEHARTKVKFRNYAQQLVDGQINLATFQTNMMVDLKATHLRLGLLGAGGKNAASKAVYGGIGQRLKEEYQFLNNFVGAIANQELSEKQIIQRAGLYANSAASAFFKSEQINRIENGANLAKRELDAGVVKHCADCPALSTNGQWLPVDLVVVPSRLCECRSNCRCIITYRSVSSTQLSDFINIAG